MPTLYVENVPDELYEALRRRARENRRSIAAEVLSMLEDHVPTAKELSKRRQLFAHAKRMSTRKPPGGRFPSTEEMIREDRSR
jgi:plasmid stability protein